MADFKNPIDQLIHDLGGTVAVAGELGVAPSVVSTWRSTGRVPKWRVDPLKNIAAEKDIPFTLNAPSEAA